MKPPSSPKALRDYPEAAPVTSDVPEYAPALDSFHRAMLREILHILRELPVRPGDRVLDVPCGDGFYSACLTYLLGERSEIVAADNSPEYLALAAERVNQALGQVPISFVQTDAYQLPFADGEFSLVWCAQSLVSLKDPVAALREIRRVLKPGGAAAVLENDEFHHLLLPWPVDLELALQQALATEGRIRYGAASRLCPGRYLRPLFLEAGYTSYRKKTYAVDRQFPLAEAERRFLLDYFQSLRDLVQPHLLPERFAELERLTEPASSQCLLDQADFEMTCLNIVSLGKMLP